MGYSPWGHKELDSTKGLTLFFFPFDCLYFYDVNCKFSSFISFIWALSLLFLVSLGKYLSILYIIF